MRGINEKALVGWQAWIRAFVKPLSNGIEMNPISNEAKNQQESAGRRGFLRKLSAAAGAVIVTAGAVAHAAPAVTARKGEAEGLTPQQRLLLAQLNEMTDEARKFIYDMAAFNARTFPREFPNVTVMPRGAV